MQLDGPLISTAALARALHEPGLRVFDTTVYLRPNPQGFGYLPESGRNDWVRGHIAGAGFLDLLGDLSDASTNLPFMMPPADSVAATLGRHGIGDDSTVVLYNTGFPMWSTRVWWMLRAIGFSRVAVLNGGLDKWRRESRPLDAGAISYPPATLNARPQPERWVDRAAMEKMVARGEPVTVNALSPEVYSGAKNQYGRAGHIPGTHNVYYGDLLDGASGEFLPVERLTPLFAASGALAAPSVVCYCGGGISATMDALALEMCGQRKVAIYDGSMSEWVRDPALPLKLGMDP
jgi:thiosulfate/3-mercaptopyruvate sulfurtransferase